MKNIRNFCIIAHIDHGKSTLADRFLELTETIAARDMKEQVLDQMSLEQERGITIKLQPVTMEHEGYVLNLIDTPGHVDFSYEVSRSLAAVEGAVLLVDATQGIQAQTLANLYLALEQDLVIIPVLNKIDLPNAQVERVHAQITNLLGCDDDQILEASGKTGQGVPEILQAIKERIPAPTQESEGTRALIFDSQFDDYRGVVTYVRVFGGSLAKGHKIRFAATKSQAEILEVGVFKPKMTATKELGTGQIGYVVTGMKDIEETKVGDTILLAKDDKAAALPGYKEVMPMVFAGVFCKDGDDYPRLRDAIGKLKLNDAALGYEPESSPALGFGFRCGFLGMLHAEIFIERLRREAGLELVMTVPSVAYRVTLTKGEPFVARSPQDLPDQSRIAQVEEPIMKADIMTPKEYVGAVMQMVQDRRGNYLNTEYLQEDRAILHYEVPLSALLVDFYDKLKGLSSGYASLNYEFSRYADAPVVRMDILVAEELVEALSVMVYRDELHKVGKKIVTSLKEVVPRQQFAVKLQAAVGGKIVAAERIAPYRKDVTAKLYGGDHTRRRKLLEKQKKGKKRMLGQGKVDIPSEAFLSVLKR